MKPIKWQAPSPLLLSFVRTAPRFLYHRGAKWGNGWTVNATAPTSVDHMIEVKVVFRSFGRKQLRYSLIGPWPQDKSGFVISHEVAINAIMESDASVRYEVLLAATPGLERIAENRKLMEAFSG